jgi:hydroxyacylglutathione hydrolase
LIYPGHDYIENNLRFTLNREPDNTVAQTLLTQVTGQDVNHAFVSTLKVEQEVNTFFRFGESAGSGRAEKKLSRLARATGRADRVSKNCANCVTLGKCSVR